MNVAVKRFRSPSERIEFRPKQLLRNSHNRTMLLAAAIAPSYHAPSSDTLAPPSNHVKSIGGSLDVAQALRCDALASRADSIALHGSLENAGDLSADRVDAGSVASSSASVARLETGTVRVTRCRSVAARSRARRTRPAPTRCRWAARGRAAVFLQAFDGEGEADGWAGGARTACGGDGVVAAAPCDGGGGAAAAPRRLTRVIAGLPAHTSLEVRASFSLRRRVARGRRRLRPGRRPARVARPPRSAARRRRRRRPVRRADARDARVRAHAVRVGGALAATKRINLTFAATVGCEAPFAVDDVEVRVV